MEHDGGQPREPVDPETVAAREREAVAHLAGVVAALPAGTAREGQRHMAEAVARSAATGRHLVVQAGTGTGKSLAYVVPAVTSGERTVVVTATRALQEQLLRRDLPFVAERLGYAFSYASLKGRSNYLCLARHAELAGEPRRLLGSREARLLDMVEEWVAETETGDRADLPRAVSDALWEKLSVDSRECPGRARCDLAESCFSEAARDRAAAADLVVVNSALYAQDLVASNAVLGPHGLVVIDEAHALEDACTAAFGVELGAVRFSRLAAAVRGFLTADEQAGEQRDPSASLADWAERIELLLGGAGSERVDLDEEGWREPLVSMAEMLASLRDVVAGVDAGGPDGALRRARVLQLLDSARADVLAVLAARPGDDAIWVEHRHRPVLRVAPVDVGPVLAAELFARRTVVLTSATLAVGDDFDAFAWRVGLRPDESADGAVADGDDAGAGPDGDDRARVRYEALDVGSPFDYRSQAILYCAAHLPDPRAAGFEEAMLDEVEALVRAAGGRTLGLCTSLRAADRMRQRLRERSGVRVLGPDDHPRAKLMDEFARDETSCLVGSMGLWQGLDVPGPSVSLVVIDRIPFARPDDPVAAARRERAVAQRRDAFATFDLPRAAMLLAQGAGRLVRGPGDRGVVAVMDPRLVRSRYGAVLLDSLPPMFRSSSAERVRSALERLRDGRPQTGGAAAP